MNEAKVAIIMGSKSDLPIMKDAVKQLKDLGIPFEVRILSAHRVEEELDTYVKVDAINNNIKVFIAGAGLNAALPGTIRAKTILPVIGVPIQAANFIPMDSVLAIIQMPPGFPVAGVGLNAAQNAAIMAAQILAINDDKLAQKLIAQKEEFKKKTLQADQDLQKEIETM